MAQFIKECSEKEFMVFSLIYLIEHQRVTDALKNRIESTKEK